MRLEGKIIICAHFFLSDGSKVKSIVGGIKVMIYQAKGVL